MISDNKIDPKTYLHEQLLNDNYYTGQDFNFSAVENDPDAIFSPQQHFSDNFIQFIDCLKQVRFELQTGQINNNEAFQRIKEAEVENGLPSEVTMDDKGMHLGAHVDNIANAFGEHDGGVRIYYDMQGQHDSADRSAVRVKTDRAHADNLASLREMLDVHADAVKAYDHGIVVQQATQTLAALFTQLGLPFDSDSDTTKMAISIMASKIHEETEPSGRIVNRALVPNGYK